MSDTDRDVYPALVVNPEAVGDPTQTPIVQLSPALAKQVATMVAIHNGWCPECKREAAPTVEIVAEALARADGTRMEWVGYEAQERYRELARAAKDVVG